MRRILVALIALAVAGGGLWAAKAIAEPVSAPAAAASSAPAAQQPETAPAASAFPAAMTERALGDEKAPVVIDEYFALTCPHCGHFHSEVLPQLKKDYIDTGKVRLVFHDFIFNEVGLKAAMISRCVSPTAYYEFTGTLFQMQTAWTNPAGGDEVLKQVAGFAGLPPAKFQACVDDKVLSDWLLQGRVDAINNLNIESTPTFLIRGSLERIVGAQPYEQFKAMIDAKLAKSAPTKP